MAGKGPGGTGGAPPPPPPPGGVPPPPPPPPPPGGAPPPPPPPPGMGPPPPPPPPGAPRAPGAPPPPGFVSPPSSNKLPYGMKQKKKYELGIQTKRINWNKVRKAAGLFNFVSGRNGLNKFLHHSQKLMTILV